jgi:opacity protein-like surface antigen
MKKLFLLLALMAGCGVGFAAAEESDVWQFNVVPTFWAAGVDIDSTTVKGRNVTVEAGFEDIFDNLKFGGALQFEAGRGKWRVLVSNLYLDLELAADYAPPVGPSVDADLGVRFNLLEVALAYRYDIGLSKDEETRPLGDFRPRASIEPVGGVRYGVLKQRIDLNITPDLLPGIGETVRSTEDDGWWLEIFVGGRLNYAFRPNWTFRLRGDIGGIESGDETVFSWNLYAGLDHKPWESASIILGYKVYDFNYEDRSNGELFELDAMLHGPVFAISLIF